MDFRSFVELLEREGELLRIKEEVDPKWEISGVLREMDRRRGPAVLFEKIKGYEARAAGNLLGSRRRLALAFGVPEGEVLEAYKMRRERLIPPRVESGGAKGIRRERNPGADLLKILPVPIWSERDAGPYITAGVILARSPKTGMLNMGIHEISALGGGELAAVVGTPPLSLFLAEAESLRRPLEAAIIIGPPIPMLLASCAPAPGVSKLDIAGGIAGEPLILTRAEVVDLPVPEEAEIIIEGRILPEREVEAGPFGDMTRYYFSYPAKIFRAELISVREDFIFHALHPQGEEGRALIQPFWSLEIERILQNLFPEVRRAKLLPGMLCDLLLISIEKRADSSPRAVLAAALTLFPSIKFAAIFDEDVDLEDGFEILRALLTRTDPQRDLLILLNLPGSDLDPVLRTRGAVGKVGIDATVPMKERERFAEALPPAEILKRTRSLVEKLLRGG